MRSKHYAQDRDQILKTLSERGWTLTPNGELCDTAELAYDNGQLGLRLEHFSVSEERAFNLFIVNPDGRELLYVVEYDDHLEYALATMVSFQGGIAPSNVGSHLGELQGVVKEVYLYRDGDIVPLSTL